MFETINRVFSQFLNHGFLFIFGLFSITPHMHSNETVLFMEYLKKSKRYLEFGLGGSTCLAIQYNNIEKIYSVEASSLWISKIENYKQISQSIRNERLTIDYVDINGDDNHWSYPIDDSKKNNWHNYYNPWLGVDFDPDFILVDGRFRVACILYIIIIFYDDSILPKVKSGTERKNDINDANQLDQLYIAIHDYDFRPHYHIVEEFLDIVVFEKSLYIFIIKKGMTREKINQTRALLETYKHDTR
jgi:hypothetical protein